MLSLESTLGQLVTANPALAIELERLHLDYCCGGQDTLLDACTAKGLDPSEVVELLESLLPAVAAEPEAWTTMGPAELVDHLVTTHHRYLWDEMPRVSALVDKIVGVHGGRHPELVEIARCWAEVRADLEPHLLKEEQVLFPLVRRLAWSTAPHDSPCETLANPISVMLREHEAVGELLAELRTRTDGFRPPPDGCASYQACFSAMAELEADTHLHIHKENNLLFPVVLALESRRTPVRR